MPDTYFIRIKKDYAASVIEDLQKMDAVELITDDNITIPQWQIDLVRKEKKKIEKDPSLLQDWNTVKQKIKHR
jgi:hypothetical protein